MHIYKPVVSLFLFVVLSSGITLAQTEPKSLGEIARELREKKQAQRGTGVSAPLSVKDGNLLSVDQYQQQIRQLLQQHDFAGLEKAAQEAGLSKGRLVGGIWQLHTFYGSISEPVTGNRASDEDWSLHLRTVYSWSEAYPESAKAREAMADTLTSYAWHFRGSGYADTVSPDRWQLFENFIAAAKKQLTEAGKLKNKDAHWFEVMQEIALAQGWEKAKARALLEEATAFAPDYYHYYQHYVTFLLPKWYGEDGEAEAFVEEASKRMEGEQQAFLYLKLAVWVNCQCGDDEAHMAHFSWAKIKQGYAFMEKNYGSSNTHKNQFAYMALLAQDKAAAREIFARIGDNWDNSVWKDRQRFDQARAWAMS